MLTTTTHISLVVSSIARDRTLSTLEFSIELSASVAMTNLPIHRRLLHLSAMLSVLGTPPKSVVVLGG